MGRQELRWQLETAGELGFLIEKHPGKKAKWKQLGCWESCDEKASRQEGQI